MSFFKIARALNKETYNIDLAVASKPLIWERDVGKVCLSPFLFFFFYLSTLFFSHVRFPCSMTLASVQVRDMPEPAITFDGSRRDHLKNRNRTINGRLKNRRNVPFPQ